MANPSDNLKNLDRAALTLAVPYGRHVGQGHLVESVNAGSASPSQQIKLRQALCEGTMDSLEGVWYDGTQITSASYTLYDGSQTTAPAAPFDLDFPHVTTALLSVTLPVGVADPDVVNNPATELKVIGKFLKVKDYDSSGAPAADAYSPSPARVIADLIHTRAGESTARTNWIRWAAWRDYQASNETVDYTALPNVDGIGLRGHYFNSTNFTSEVSSRIDPAVYYDTSTGAPALGLTGTAFSVRWVGKLKAKTTGTYTFAADHNDSVKLWVGDLTTALIDQAAAGSHSNTKALTANTFYDIKIEWTNAASDSQFKLYWTPPSGTSQTIPMEFLYPEVVSQPRYEAHALFAAPTDADAAVRQVLSMSNSIMQMADGERNFYCVEELTPVMSVTEEHIKDGTLKWYRRDRRGLRNHWQALFRNLESQYLEVAEPSVTIEFPDLQDASGRIVNGQALDLNNMTYWQAYKVLSYVTAREVAMDIFAEFDASAATYKVLPGDLITVTHSQPGWVAKQFLVTEAVDYSAEDTPDRRGFVCIEWNWTPPTVVLPPVVLPTSGLFMQLDAGAITGLVDGDAVGTWPDSSGNSRNATQATAGLKPIYKTNILNGKPVVRFDGVDDFLDLANLSALTAGEVFVVVKINNDPPTDDLKTGLWDMGTETSATRFPYTDGTLYEEFGTTVRKVIGNPSSTLTSFRVYNIYSATNDWQAFLDGSSLFSTTTNTVGFPSAPTLGKAHSGSTGLDYFLDGDTAEIIIYDHKLSSTDRDSVRDYLHNKYLVG